MAKRKQAKFIRIVNLRSVGVSNIKQFIKNMQKINEQITLSEKHTCFIEALSMRLQKIDLWLRILIRMKEGKDIKKEEKFGSTLKRARKHLPTPLFNKVNRFNKERVKAIHHFVFGEGDYSEIIKASKDFEGLTKEVIAFVLVVAKKTGPFYKTLPEATKG